MEETPEQARYTASLNLFFVDQEKNPFPDTFVFVPALRRSLRLASTARCSPVFGFDWSYDDAKTNGFNGSTSIYTGDFLADRKILTLAHFNQDGAIFPGGLSDAAGLPEAFVGQVGSARTCGGRRSSDPERSGGLLLFEPDHLRRPRALERQLGRSVRLEQASCGSRFPTTMMPATSRDSVPQWDGVASTAMDFQNSHETVWCGFGNDKKIKPYLLVSTLTLGIA